MIYMSDCTTHTTDDSNLIYTHCLIIFVNGTMQSFQCLATD